MNIMRGKNHFEGYRWQRVKIAEEGEESLKNMKELI